MHVFFPQIIQIQKREENLKETDTRGGCHSEFYSEMYLMTHQINKTSSKTLRATCTEALILAQSQAGTAK